jgi:hypothetical protein
MRYSADLKMLMVGCENAGSKYAWEGKMLYQAGSVEQRTKFADQYLENFEFLGENSDLYPFFQTRVTYRNVEGGFNLSPPSSVSWRYLLAWDAIVDVVLF